MKLDTQQNLLQVLDRCRTYWLQRLSGDITRSFFPYDFIRAENDPGKADLFEFDFDSATSLGLFQMSGADTRRLYIILHSVIALVLYRYSNNDDLILGAPILKQKAEGDYLNTLVPIRSRIDLDRTFKELVWDTRKILWEAYQHQNYPLKALCSELHPEKSGAGMDLFDVVVALENIHHEPERKAASGNFKVIFKFSDQRLSAKVQYHSGLYRRETVSRIVRNIRELVPKIMAEPGKLIKDINVLSAAERHRLLAEFNPRGTIRLGKGFLHEMFEEQVRKTPEHVALITAGQQITYRELNEKANRLAAYLRSIGVCANQAVGVMAEPSVEMVTALLSILKAGAAYLPLDPAYPRERLEFMAEDTAVKWVLTQREYCGYFSGPFEWIDIQSRAAGESDPNDLVTINQPSDLAYIIYTSGSTGKPKGVMIEHRAVAATIEWRKKEYGLSPNDRVLQLFSICFDGFVTSFFTPITSGAGVVLLENEAIKNPQDIGKAIVKHRVTHFISVPVLFASIMEALEPNEAESLRMVTLAGDKVTPNTVGIAKAKNPRLELINEYGPTENSVVSTICRNLDCKANIKIGRPVANTQIYLLHPNHWLCPIGVVGEMYISGGRLGRGYLNRPELTAKRFIPNPFVPGARMYQTGDLAKWDEEGNLEFAGRNDFQIKIRGYRIELGEIEAKLALHPMIKEYVVTFGESESGTKYMCVYFVAHETLQPAALREYLVRELPEYMVPSFLIAMEQLPVGINGKVDHQALPKPQSCVQKDSEYREPGNEVEKILVKMFEEVLGVERIGVNDNYFHLGGDSIKTIQITSRLRKYDLKLKVKDFFDYPTIAGLSRRIRRADGPIREEPVSGRVLFTPIQKWFFAQNPVVNNQYTHSILLKLKCDLNPEQLKSIFDKLVEHHDALRMIFNRENGRISQYNRPMAEDVYGFTVVDLKGLPGAAERIRNEAAVLHNGIDIAGGPLIRIAFFKTDAGPFLLMVIHHLLIDGVSWRIILGDMATACKQLLNRQELRLEPKTTSFQEWAAFLNRYAHSRQLMREAAYWSGLNAQGAGVLPRKRKAQSNKVKDGNTLRCLLDEEYTGKLLQNCNHAYHSEINDLLLTALTVTVAAWLGSLKVAVKLEAHGREEIGPGLDLSGTIGWFTAAYPVIFTLDDPADLSLGLRTVKETLRKIPHKGVGYGILRYLNPQAVNGIQKLDSIAEISFNYMGQFDYDFNTEFFQLDEYRFDSAVGGDIARDCGLDMVCMVIGRQLEISLNYQREEFDASTMEEFLEAYLQTLRRLIDHCCSVKETVYTPSDFGAPQLSLAELEVLQARYGGDLEKIYRLSALQEAMVFHALMAREAGHYSELSLFTATGAFSPELFEKSFNGLIEKYEVLRTRFAHEALNRPRQVVLKKSLLKMHFEDISTLNPGEQHTYIETFFAGQKRDRFNLATDGLIRLTVFKTAATSYRVGMNFHHIIMDGWSIGILFRELFRFYDHFQHGRRLDRSTSNPYSSYLEWLDNQDDEAAQVYWKNYLGGYRKGRGLASLAAPVPEGQVRQSTVSIVLNENLTRALMEKAGQNSLTFNSVVETAWGIVLHKCLHLNDLVLGTVVSGRQSEIEGIEEMIGLFINTIPLRISIEGTETFLEIAHKLQDGVAQSETYSFYPLAAIQSLLGIKDLIDHIVVFENYPLDLEAINRKFAGTGFQISDALTQEQSNYPLDIAVIPGKQTVIVFGYNTLAFRRELIDGLSGFLKNVLEAVSQRMDRPIRSLKLWAGDDCGSLLAINRGIGGERYHGWTSKAANPENLLKAEFDFSR